MTAIVTTSLAILAEIACTPDIDGGIGPVAIGTPTESNDGRFAVCHPFAGVDRAWLESYLAGYPGTLVLDRLPDDWLPKGWQEAPPDTDDEP